MNILLCCASKSQASNVKQQLNQLFSIVVPKLSKHFHDGSDQVHGEPSMDGRSSDDNFSVTASSDIHIVACIKVGLIIFSSKYFHT